MLLRQLHRWLGLPMGVLFLITFGTGLLTAVDELLTRGQFSDFRYQHHSLEQQAAVLQTLTAQHNDIRMLTLPSPEQPYYQVIKRGERISYGMDQLTPVLHQRQQPDGFFDTVLQLHRNWLLGREGLFGIAGAEYVAWFSLGVLLLSVLGLWLWWPMRKTFKVQKLLPTQPKRAAYFYAHMHGGVVCLLLIVLMAITGAAMTYRGVIKNWWVETETAPSAIVSHQSLNADWASWLVAAQQVLPDGRLARIVWPRGKGRASENAAATHVSLRYVHPSDWFGLANSEIQLDLAQSRLVHQRLFASFTFAEKCLAMLNPLHTGRGLATGYVWLLLCLSGLGVVMTLSGVVSFVLKLRRRKRKTVLSPQLQKGAV